MHSDQGGWPVVRVRRVSDQRTLFRANPSFEVEHTPAGGTTERWRTEDPVGVLTRLGLPPIDAGGMVGKASMLRTGAEGPWVGLPEGRRAQPRDIPRIRVRRLKDDGHRERYELTIDDGPVEDLDADGLWERIRRWTHPADDAAPRRAWNALYAQGDHTTWVDYVSGGIVGPAEPPLSRLVRILDGTAALLSATAPVWATRLRALADRGRAGSEATEVRAIAQGALDLFLSEDDSFDALTLPKTDGRDRNRLLIAYRSAIRDEAQRLVQGGGS